MPRSRPLLFVPCAFLLVALSALEAQKLPSTPRLRLLGGPASAPLGNVAKVGVPFGCVFLDAENTRLFLNSRGEPVSGHELGFLTSTNQVWSVLFIFDEGGYVKDDEKDKLDPAKLLHSIQQGVSKGNKDRQRNGNAPIEVVGWEIPPKYDPVQHNLEWAIRGVCEGRPMVNCNTRLLGRKGVMEVILVVAPERLSETLPVFRKVLAGCSYQPGQTYAEFRPGDPVAKYGLAALVVGGAALGAGKSGLLAWVWLPILLVLLAAAGWWRMLFPKRAAAVRPTTGTRRGVRG